MYCFCDGVSYGEILRCDDEDCEGMGASSSSDFVSFVSWSIHVVQSISRALVSPRLPQEAGIESCAARDHQSSRMSCSLCSESRTSSRSLHDSSLCCTTVCMYALMFALICVFLQLNSATRVMKSCKRASAISSTRWSGRGETAGLGQGSVRAQHAGVPAGRARAVCVHA